MHFEPQVYNINDYEKWKIYLDEEGYVVLSDILPEDDIVKAFSIFLDDMKKVSPTFNIENTDTYDIKYTPIMFAKGMAVFNGFGNSDFMWYLRTHPNILHIYEQLFSTKELNVSMDGFSMFVSSDQKPGQWLHIDQNPKNKTYSIQGAYNFLKVDKLNSGLIVVPKSHKNYQPKVDHNNDWVVYNKYKYGFENLEQQAVKLIIPDNCFVLWNSKTIHSNTGMIKPSRNKVKQFDRLTCYIAYLPKSIIPHNMKDSLTEKRIEAYKNGESTSHWANKCELKKYPYGFGPTYEKRKFLKIIPTLNKDNEIPKERLRLL